MPTLPWAWLSVLFTKGGAVKGHSGEVAPQGQKSVLQPSKRASQTHKRVSSSHLARSVIS